MASSIWQSDHGQTQGLNSIAHELHHCANEDDVVVDVIAFCVFNITFKRKVLIGTALYTDGFCYVKIVGLKRKMSLIQNYFS